MVSMHLNSALNCSGTGSSAELDERSVAWPSASADATSIDEPTTNTTYILSGFSLYLLACNWVNMLRSDQSVNIAGNLRSITRWLFSSVLNLCDGTSLDIPLTIQLRNEMFWIAWT